MASFHLLGTGAGISGPDRGTTMLAFQSDGNSILVDCGGDAIRRAIACGLDVAKIDALIVTHEHPDHVAGFPLLVEKLWLAGRKEPLPVFGVAAALDQAKRCFLAFTLKDWPNMVQIEWNEVPFEKDAIVLSTDDWIITGCPTKHPVDTIGLRVEHRGSKTVVVYSCDTAPSEQVAAFARNADILIHEATEFELSTSVHTSIPDAARIASEVDAGRLILVHLPANLRESHLEPAKEIFSNVEFGTDYSSYVIG